MGHGRGRLPAVLLIPVLCLADAGRVASTDIQAVWRAGADAARAHTSSVDAEAVGGADADSAPAARARPEAAGSRGARQAPVSEPCPLCAEDPGVPVVQVGAAEVDSLARDYALRNRAQIARIDSLLRSGAWGPPSSAEARRTAHVMARILTLDDYHFMFRYAADSTCVHQFDEGALAAVFRNYMDPSLFPIARLQRARLGLGRVCLHYDLGQRVDSHTVMGGKEVRVRVKDVRLEGRKRRVLIVDMPTLLFEMVEVVLADHFCGQVEHTRGDGPPGPYELFLVHDIQGGWLRKWGTHRPQAFMMWRTPYSPDRTELPEAPLMGVRVYVPHLRLKLPSILPDIGFDNLREVDPPQPFLDLQYVAEHQYPDWLLADDKLLGFRDWMGVGPIPPDIRRRFPNL